MKKRFFSIRWYVWAWSLLNLAVGILAVVVFLRLECGLGFNSLLSGSTGQRLEALAEPLRAELRRTPPAAWNAALARAFDAYRLNGRLHAAVVDDQGRLLAGELPPLPPEVRHAVVRTPPPGENASAAVPPGPPRPPPDMASGRMDQFLLRAATAPHYWAGVYLQDIGSGMPGSVHQLAALVIASDSLRGGGLFFRYHLWLGLFGGLALVTVLLWVPFIRRLTRGLADMTRAAEQIAAGRFQPPTASPRHDELGGLGRAMGNMTLQLESYVTGQKRFLGDTAHELLSPLARLEVSLSILEQKVAAADAPTVERALDDVHQLAGHVRELLTFAKTELRGTPAVMQRVQLAPLARGAVRREGGGATVEIKIPDALCALADPDLLDRALGNTVRNAVRYAGHAGPITIFAASSTESPSEVVLSVSDVGPGAPEGVLERLFDPFYRPDSAPSKAASGAGLGLAIVKSCVETCGGSVSASNRTSRGLAVIFRLRRADPV